MDTFTENKPQVEIADEYKELMVGYEPTVFTERRWEKRGDSYVQFSFYDQEMVGTSVCSLTGSLVNQ